MQWQWTHVNSGACPGTEVLDRVNAKMNVLGMGDASRGLTARGFAKTHVVPERFLQRVRHVGMN